MAYDAIIIGAGAAGTYCAIHAANRGLHVLLLDHNPDLGAKIRVSGGGRCNFTNTGARADTYYSHNPHFPRGALARHPPQDVLDWFGARGITWHEKHLGQIFADQRSRGILAALHDALVGSGATLHTATTLHEHHHDGDHFHLRTSRGDYRTPHLIIACGAPSYPKLGATDLALRIAKQHHIANYPYRPALVPLTLDHPPTQLAGISHDVIIQCDGAPAFRDQLLYTHRGISGPAVLQISTWWQRGATITLNHLPDLPADALVAAKRAQPQQTLAHFLRAHLPRAVADHLASTYPAEPLQHHSDAALLRILAELQHHTITPTGTEGMHKAEACSGGIDTRELDPKTFRVKKRPGLYIIGEALDITGWLGGYNLQWAWSSAWSCAQYLGAD